MFNRRFFETKFSGFFGMVRRDTEKDMIEQTQTVINRNGQVHLLSLVRAADGRWYQ